MSLAIDVDKICGVLLSDGWHTVADKSFYTDSYEFLAFYRSPSSGNDYEVLHGGGQSGVCATGFSFLENLATDYAGGAYQSHIVRVCGPLTALLAVQEDRPDLRTTVTPTVTSHRAKQETP